MREHLNPWQPITVPITLKHLGKLAEELNECGSAVARCIIQGVDGTEPDTGKVNREWLQEEIADVIANAQLVIEHLGLCQECIDARVINKKQRLRTWHAMLSPGENPVGQLKLIEDPKPCSKKNPAGHHPGMFQGETCPECGEYVE